MTTESPADTRWRSVTLDKVYEFRSGLSKPASEFGSGYPFLTFKDVFYNYFTPDTLGDLVQSTDRERATCDIRRGDVFLTRTSETMDDLGMSCVALKDYPEATFNGFTKRLRPLDQRAIDPAYAGYYFRSRDFRVAVTAMSTLSTRASLNNEMLARLTIRLPDIKTQQAIGSVLLAFDDKIELNRRMNRTLEQMAAAIFKAWFVDFEPVRAKASGAASFPGMPQPVFDALPAAFTDSELGPIPEEWTAGCIGDIGKNRRDGIKPDEIDPETPYIGLEHMPKRCIALDAWDGTGKVTSGKSEFSRGEILFGKLRPYFHKVGVAPIDGVCSTDVLVVKPQAHHWSALLLGHLSSLDFVNYTDACSTGTKMPRTNWKDMARYPIAVPPEPVAAEATRLTKPMVEQILSNIHESRTLAETRDALLPKLLSGEVRVAALEEVA